MSRMTMGMLSLRKRPKVCDQESAPLRFGASVNHFPFIALALSNTVSQRTSSYLYLASLGMNRNTSFLNCEFSNFLARFTMSALIHTPMFGRRFILPNAQWRARNGWPTSALCGLSLSRGDTPRKLFEA